MGYCEKGKHAAQVEGKATFVYILWKNMLRRCYSKETLEDNPSYIGCSVSENFLNFQFFAEWCNNQVGYRKETYCLDKDILVRGNKVYSENNCVFVPQKINLLLGSNKRNRGDYPIGVSWNKELSKYKAQIKLYCKQTHIGYFDSIGEAFNAYKIAKEFYIKQVANEYKESIDPRVYSTLLSWEVNIDD